MYPIPRRRRTSGRTLSLDDFRSRSGSSSGGLSTAAAAELIARSRSGGGGGGRRPVALGRPARPEGGHGQQEGRSIGRQIGDAFLGIPRGLLALGSAGVKELAHTVDPVERIKRLNPWYEGNQADPVSSWEEVGQRLTQDPDRPLTGMLATSVGNTAMRVRHPSRYLQASDESRLVDVLLEDVGNLSLAGGVAAKGLRAGGLPGAATQVEKVSALGGRTADLPVSVIREGVVKPLGGAVRRGLQRSDVLRASRPDLLTEQGIGARSLTRSDLREAQLEKVQIERRLHRAASEIGATPAEEAAAFAEHYGVARAYREARDAHPEVDPEIHRRNVALHDRPEQTFGPEARQVIDDLDARTLNPDAVVRIKALRDVLDREAGELGELYDAGEGRFGKDFKDEVPGDVRQRIGDEPIGEHVVQRVREVAPGIDDPASMDWIDVAQWLDDAEASGVLTGEQIADVLADPNIYPSRFRPGLTALGRARGRAYEMAQYEAAPELNLGRYGTAKVDPTTGKVLTEPTPFEDLPVPEGNADLFGLDPTYLPGGRSAILHGPVARIRTRPLNEGLFGIRPLDSQLARTNSLEMPYSLRTAAEKIAAERFRIRSNQSAARVREQYGKTVADQVREVVDPATGKTTKVVEPGLLDQQTLADIDARARAVAQSERTGTAGYRLARGQFLMDEMEGRGYEAWAPNMDPTRGVSPAKIDPSSTVWLEAGLRARLAPWWSPYVPTGGWALLERFNALFRRSVLPFSIRWQVGDATGNAYMAWAAGGVPPDALIARLRDVRRARGTELGELLDANTTQASLSFPEAQWLVGEDGRMPPPRTPLGRPIRAIQEKSFAFNTAMNRLERQAYLLEKVERLLGDETVVGPGALPLDDPRVTAAVREAVDDASRVLGNMDDLTPFERQKMRAIFTFYPWVRHVTKLAWNLGVDDPVRLVWTARIGTMVAEDEMPPFLRGSILGPGGYYQPSFMNPLADVGQAPVFTPEGALRAVSPALKIAAAAAGLDANRMMLPITRPPNTGRRDEYGREGVTPLILPSNWDELAYTAAKQFPLPRELLNLAPEGEIPGTDIATGPVPRWGSGEAITRGPLQRPIDRDPRWYSPLRLVGIPTPETPEDVARAVQTIRERRRRNERRG